MRSHAAHSVIQKRHDSDEDRKQNQAQNDNVSERPHSAGLGGMDSVLGNIYGTSTHKIDDNEPISSLARFRKVGTHVMRAHMFSNQKNIKKEEERAKKAQRVNF